MITVTITIMITITIPILITMTITITTIPLSNVIYPIKQAFSRLGHFKNQRAKTMRKYTI